jgi:hypothetical protein
LLLLNVRAVGSLNEQRLFASGTLSPAHGVGRERPVLATVLPTPHFI